VIVPQTTVTLDWCRIGCRGCESHFPIHLMPSVLLIAVLLCCATAAEAHSLCYQFSSGNSASLNVTITNLPAPTMGTDVYGNTTFDYDLHSLTGNSATLMVGTNTATAALFSGPISQVSPTFTIHIVSGPVESIFFLQIAAASSTANGLVAEVQLAATNETTPMNPPNGLLPSGLPSTLPPLSAWGVQSGATPVMQVQILPAGFGLPISFFGNIDSIRSGCSSSCATATSAMAQSIVFAPQEQSNWCWAAVTEMLVVNANGGNQTSQTRQCFIANQVLRAGVDPANPQSPYCCSPANASACNRQENVLTGLEVLGYQATDKGHPIFGVGGLTQQDIINEISCNGRVIGIMVSYQPLFRVPIQHVMIIYGYNTTSGEMMLSVYDPQAKIIPGVYKFPVSYANLLQFGGILPGYGLLDFYYDVRPLADTQ
jgi:hypothetical protein